MALPHIYAQRYRPNVIAIAIHALWVCRNGVYGCIEEDCATYLQPAFFFNFLSRYPASNGIALAPKAKVAWQQSGCLRNLSLAHPFAVIACNYLFLCLSFPLRLLHRSLSISLDALAPRSLQSTYGIMIADGPSACAITGINASQF